MKTIVRLHAPRIYIYLYLLLSPSPIYISGCSSDWPGTYCVDQASLELTGTHLPLLPECLDSKTCTYKPSLITVLFLYRRLRISSIRQENSCSHCFDCVYATDSLLVKGSYIRKHLNFIQSIIFS